MKREVLQKLDWIVDVLHLKRRLLSLLVTVMGAQLPFAVSRAETLTQLALFHRCYAHLTQTRPDALDSLTVAIRTGSMSALTACTSVLNSAVFSSTSGDTRIANTADHRAKAVLSTFQDLHRSWFLNKDLHSDFLHYGTNDIYDTSTPAFYFTRSLFHRAAPVRDVVTLNANLRAVRAVPDPARGPASDRLKSEFMFSAPFSFARVGPLYGIEPTDLLATRYSFTNQTLQTGVINLGATRGGGVLGNSVYLISNVNEEWDFQADGDLKTPRKWSKAVLNDLLCRALPAVRATDVSSFVLPSSDVSFRASASCNRCHATMDRMAGVIRNFKFYQLGRIIPPFGGVHPSVYPTLSSAAENILGWPTNVANYHALPTRGVFYFRGYDGSLKNQVVNNVSGLGAAIAAQPDFYICVAKRYFEYFTGITAEIGDIGDPGNLKTLSPSDLSYRNRVIALGKSLQTHQSLRTLIGDIISQPIYRESDFGLRE